MPPTLVRPLFAVGLTVVLAGCLGSTPTLAPSSAPTGAPATPTALPATPWTGPIATPRAWHFPGVAFAGLSTELVSEELAAKLQAALEAAAKGDGVTATLITSLGTWSGATGKASAERAMAPNTQVAIASTTKTITATQVMQLVEGGRLGLRDLAADRLPPGLDFDANGATIEDLLSMRSGISEYFADEDELVDALTRDPLRVWTVEEKLATVDPKRGPVGQDREWEYLGTNYLLLGLIIEHVTGGSLGEAFRSGVLAGADYDRLIVQPDERPTAPVALAGAASDATFDDLGGYLPSLANATMFTTEGSMASDSLSLARWFRALCAGEIVTPASLDEMTDLRKRPEYGLGIWDRRYEYGAASGAIGHTGYVREGGRTAAFCFQHPALVVVVLSNVEHDVETTAGNLVNIVFPGAAA